MADEQATPEETPSKAPAPRKELDGFQITRAAPAPQQGPPVMAFILVILVMLGLAGAAYKLSNDDPAPGDDGKEPDVTQPTFPPDAEVEGYVWDRLEFLESEGNLEKALEFAEEHNELTPHSKLRLKVAGLKKALGIGVEDRTLEELLIDARGHFANGRFQQAYDDAEEAIDVDNSSAEAFYLRGAAKGELDDKLSAITDLETAIDLGYSEREARALIKQYEN